MNNATLMRVRQAGTNLLEIEKRPVDRQGVLARKRRHVATGQVLQDDVMKSSAGKIDGGAMAQPVDNVWMAHAIKRDCVVLKITYQRMFEVSIGRVLKKHVQGLDDHGGGRAFRRSVVMRYIDLGIAAAPKAFNN